VSSLEEIRTVVRRSFETKTYEPGDTRDWTGLGERFSRIVDAARTLNVGEGD
jgi:hypothetical protein